MSSSIKFNNALVSIDEYCDYVPFASSAVNFVHIFEKAIFNSCCSDDYIVSHNYVSHITDKSTLRCVTLLVPILGNIVVGIYDFINKRKWEKEEINIRAVHVGLKSEDLPKSTSKKIKIIEAAEHEQMQRLKQLQTSILNLRIGCLQESLNTFRNFLSNPNEPIEIEFVLNGTHQEQIDEYWLYLRCVFPMMREKFDEDVALREKQEEFAELNRQFVELRQTSYREYIESIDDNQLLEEAKKYYVLSFFDEEHNEIAKSLEGMTLETMYPKLKKRELEIKNHYTKLIEVREIIIQYELNQLAKQ